MRLYFLIWICCFVFSEPIQQKVRILVINCEDIIWKPITFSDMFISNMGKDDDTFSTFTTEEDQRPEHVFNYPVTHNMQQAARVSDYTAFFYIGQLIEFGKTTKIFTKPEKKQTEDYITGRVG